MATGSDNTSDINHGADLTLNAEQMGRIPEIKKSKRLMFALLGGIHCS